MKRIGELLVESGLISQSDIDKALEIQKRNNKQIGEILIEMKLITIDTLLKYLDIQIKTKKSL